MANSRNVSIILVENVNEALKQIAKYKRTQLKIPVVAITGSVGKTSTKDLIASVLSQKYKVLKTQGNMNNNIGMPMTILKIKDEDCLVVEMGMNHFGEIRELTNIAKPSIAVITNIGTAHIGNLGSRENILKAKLEILEGLQENNVVINNDNDLLHKWYLENKNNKKYNIITFGIKETESKVCACNIKNFEDKTVFDAVIKDNGNKIRKEITLKMLGDHFILDSLSAIAVGNYFNIPMEEIAKGIKDVNLTQKRMELEKAKNGALIINDTYNANYDSMKAAITYLQSVKDRRKIAVLGDMLELGNYSEELHKNVGKCITDVDILITVGKESKNIENEAKAKEKYHFNNNEDAIKKLKEIMTKDDIILLKASNSMKFGEIVNAIL